MYLQGFQSNFQLYDNLYAAKARIIITYDERIVLSDDDRT
jgi:hypothetical protein